MRTKRFDLLLSAVTLAIVLGAALNASATHMTGPIQGAQTNLEPSAAGQVYAASVADDYEYDDSMGYAKAIVVTGSDTLPQAHSFHTPSDADWIMFYARKDVFYTVKVDNVGSACDAAFKLYDGAGKLLNTVDDYSKGHVEFLDYKTPVDGIYYLKVYNTDLMSCSTGETGYSITVFNPYMPSNPSKVTGKALDSESGNSIAYARIKVGTDYSALSNSSGTYILTLPQNSYTLTIEADGYEASTETLNITDLQMSHDIKLKKTAQTAEQVLFDGSLLTIPAVRFENNCYSLVLRYDPSYSQGAGFRIENVGSATTCGTAGGPLIYSDGGIYRLDLPEIEYSGKTYWTSFEYVPDEGILKLTDGGEKI